MVGRVDLLDVIMITHATAPMIFMANTAKSGLVSDAGHFPTWINNMILYVIGSFVIPILKDDRWACNDEKVISHL